MSKAKDRFDFVETRNFKKFTTLNFDESLELYEFDVTNATDTDRNQAIATILKLLQGKR